MMNRHEEEHRTEMGDGKTQRKSKRNGSVSAERKNMCS